MTSKPTYEIYTLAKGRWIVDAKFKGTEKQAAIDDAKRIGQQPGVEQAKVVREILLEDGLIKESTIFKTTLKSKTSNGGSDISATPSDPIAATAKRKKRATGNRLAPKRDRRSAAGGRKSKDTSHRARFPLSSGARLAVKLLMIGLTSFAFATTSTLLSGRYLVN